MAPTTLNSTTTIGSDSVEDTTGKVSLYISIAALTMSTMFAFFQLLVSYASSATGRSKTNSAALGEWSKYTKYGLSDFWKGRMSVKYACMRLSVKGLLGNLLEQKRRKVPYLAMLAKYKPGVKMSMHKSKDGLEIGEAEVVLHDPKTGLRAPAETLGLSFLERQVLQRLNRFYQRSTEATRLSTASYPILAARLGFDVTLIPRETYEDADRIPAALGAPLISVRLSDMIIFGYLLDMKLMGCNPSTRSLSMTGVQSYIVTEFIPGIGPVCRYMDMDHTACSFAVAASLQELDALVDTAKGTICFLDRPMPMSLLGYNSMNAMLQHAQSQAKDESWQEIKFKAIKGQIESDNHIRWNKKWSCPKTNPIAFVLATGASMAVAQAFPHVYLGQWGVGSAESVEVRPIDSLSKEALSVLSENNVHLISPPETIYEALNTKGVLNSNSYKIANNYGCEYGGYRGFLCSNFAYFTDMVADCWEQTSSQNQGNTYTIPLLPALLPYLEQGQPLSKWSSTYSKSPIRGDTWKTATRGILWLQVMFLDTWISANIDKLMGSPVLEVPVPATKVEAEQSLLLTKDLPDTTAINPKRCKWAQMYLERLADGYKGHGESIMSDEPRPNSKERWQNMEVGSSEQWLVLDAALTLRALIMRAMLLYLDDSSIMADLIENDPLVYLS